MSKYIQEKCFDRYDELDNTYINEEDERKSKSFHLKCDCCRCVSQRYLMAFLTCIGFLISFGIRCNMGVAILAMTKINRNYTNFSSSKSTNDSNRISNSSSCLSLPEFTWTSDVIGVVDSSFFWGYLITQIPGGYLTSRLPANRIFGLTIGTSAFLNLLLPAAAKMHYGLVIAVRILQGLVEGMNNPACHGIWRYWAPKLERTKLATISFCGMFSGAVLGMPISGILTKHFGWPAGFYALNTPTPWLHFLKSMPVYAIIVENFCASWTFFLMIVSQPRYITEVFRDDVEKSGMLSSLPYILLAIIIPIAGQIADNLRKRLLTTTAVRKIFNCGGYGLESSFLLGVGMIRNETTAVICMMLAVGSSGLAVSGYSVNHLDIAPRYAAILLGLSNTFGSLAAIVCPIVTELLTKDATADQWQTVFIIASAIQLFGITFYGLFASGELQPWAEPFGEDTWKPDDSLTYGAFEKYKDSCNDIIPMNETMGNRHASSYSVNNAKETSSENHTSGEQPTTFGHNSLDGPVYKTRGELIQVPSKDKYLTEDRDL